MSKDGAINVLYVIINPTAGNGLAGRVGEQVAGVLREKGLPFEMAQTRHEGHATELARDAADRGVDTVIAVGGDGTLREVARGLCGLETAMGIIPAGTGNDVIKMLGTPSDPMEALDFILKNPARRLDAGQIGDSLFLNVTGTGFDVCVLQYALGAKKYVRGILPYLWGVIRAMFAYKAVKVTLQIDGEEPFQKEILVASVGNGQYIGGGMHITPEARPDDGLFDLLVIDMLPKWKIVPNFPKLLNGKIREVPGSMYRNCRSVTFEAPGMFMNIDGEIIPMDRAEMKLLPQALLVHW